MLLIWRGRALMLSRISDGAGMTGGAAALLVLLGTIIVAYTGLRWKRTIR